MKSLLKFVALVAFFVIGGGLLVYAASRSLDFVQTTLPAKDQVLGYFALLATSGGMIGWLLGLPVPGRRHHPAWYGLADGSDRLRRRSRPIHDGHALSFR